MPIRISNKWLRKRLRTLARLRNDDWGHDWQIQTAPYTTGQEKAIRRMQRDLLSKTVCRMQDWEVYEVQLPRRTERTRHIVGTVDHRNTMRVSSAVASIDSAWREAATETGEKFHFGARVQGGVNVDTYFAWWRDKNGATDVVRVTPAVRRLLAPVRMRPAVVRSEEEMWAEKRARQAADLAGLQSGELTNDDVNWFSEGVAKRAKIKGDLF